MVYLLLVIQENYAIPFKSITIFYLIFPSQKFQLFPNYYINKSYLKSTPQLAEFGKVNLLCFFLLQLHQSLPFSNHILLASFGTPPKSPVLSHIKPWINHSTKVCCRSISSSLVNNCYSLGAQSLYQQLRKFRHPNLFLADMGPM